MQRALNYDQSPGLHMTLRHFQAAAAFALLACLLLLWQGPAALASRWTPAMLAATHLLGLGSLTLSIIGALFQILPVVTGKAIPGTPLLSTVVPVLVGAGALTLAAAFLLGRPVLFALAATLLGMGLGLFATALAAWTWLVRRQVADGAIPLVRAMRLALVALVTAGAAGITAALARAGIPGPLLALDALSLPVPALGALHVGWALGGWITLTVVAVAPQVIPMFQVTECYPARSNRWLPLALFGSLMLWSIGLTILPQGNAMPWIALPAWTCVALFVALTLRTLRTRKRPQPDATTWFWILSVGSLAVSLCLVLATAAGLPQAALAAGALFLAGFGWTAVSGMLYTIVPFLVWLHAHRHALAVRPHMPKLRDILPNHIATRHACLHLVGLALLGVACAGQPWLARPAALALAASAIWSSIGMRRAWRIYTAAQASIR